MKLKHFLIPMLFIIPIQVISQTKSAKKSPVLTEAAPESVGVSAARLSRIDQVCNDAIQNGDIPGVVALMVRNGKIIHWKAYGMADNQAGKVLKRDDIFRIASQSKSITATFRNLKIRRC
jgi:CubicO group peptidase (beta-lactamase class C family)